MTKEEATKCETKGRGRQRTQKKAPPKRGPTLQIDTSFGNPSPSPVGEVIEGCGDKELIPSKRRKVAAANPVRALKRKADEKPMGIIVTAGDPTVDHQKAEDENPAPSIKKKHLKKYIGAHLSIQGGIWKAVVHAVQIGARALGLFLRPQRSWSSKPLDASAAERFRLACVEHNLQPKFILPHSPYLMNLGSPRPDVCEKSRAMLVEEMQRCQQLGLTLYNLHPGSRVGAMSVGECLDRIADGLNYAHKQVEGVTTVLENMSCQGTTVGGRFEELRGIIDRVADKSRVGVCLDTCHAFAAGHDLSQKDGLDKMLQEFSQVVGLHYLKALHLNDSKGALGCHLDRHQNIGQGHIGLDGFRHIMNEPRFDGLPMILETPATHEGDDHAVEIQLLYSLCDEEGERAQKEEKGGGGGGAGDRK
ncbi:putative endonuclease 4 isoform X2 [Lissotriton helveticus]